MLRTIEEEEMLCVEIGYACPHTVPYIFAGLRVVRPDVKHPCSGHDTLTKNGALISDLEVIGYLLDYKDVRVEKAFEITGFYRARYTRSCHVDTAKCKAMLKGLKTANSRMMADGASDPASVLRSFCDAFKVKSTAWKEDEGVNEHKRGTLDYAVDHLARANKYTYSTVGDGVDFLLHLIKARAVDGLISAGRSEFR